MTRFNECSESGRSSAIGLHRNSWFIATDS